MIFYHSSKSQNSAILNSDKCIQMEMRKWHIDSILLFHRCVCVVYLPSLSIVKSIYNLGSSDCIGYCMAKNKFWSCSILLKNVAASARKIDI